MDTQELIRWYPRLYHMAEDGSWPSIQGHGLLSTRALLDLFEIRGAQRDMVYSNHRPDSVRLRHPEHGSAVVRDQKPMGDSGLRRSLEGGLTPRDWYQLLNDRVFFWATEERLDTLLNARAYRDKTHCVIVVDTEKLLACCSERVTLSPINSGCTKPMPRPRGPTTFLPINDYPFDEWARKRRSRRAAVVEVAVAGGVPNIETVAVTVERRGGDGRLEVLWPRRPAPANHL